MGYEMGFVDHGHDWDNDVGKTYWYCCGWDKLELFRAVERLSGNAADPETGIVEVPVGCLRFVEDIAERVRQQDLYRVVEAISSLSWDYGEELVASMPPVVKAAMALPFACEGASDAEADVRRILCESSLEGSAWLVIGLADAVREMEGDGAAVVDMYGG